LKNGVKSAKTFENIRKNEHRNQESGDRRQRTEDRGRTTGDGRQRIEEKICVLQPESAVGKRNNIALVVYSAAVASGSRDVKKFKK